MSDSDIYSKFDEIRPDLTPYGWNCELWIPTLMRRPDRHNEIEINFCPEGSITYLVKGQRVEIPQKRLAIFWALAPHQIIHFEDRSPYFVCTIPFTLFLEWNLPRIFVDRILSGEVIISSNEPDWKYEHDHHFFKDWSEGELRGIGEETEATMLEIRARLIRLALNIETKKDLLNKKIDTPEFNLIEKMVIYIAKNYTSNIKPSDIGRTLGLHPDYANSVFKKNFGITLSEYLVEQRILHAQRMLSLTKKSIIEIAFDSGFNSISRFNASFLKTCNCTPREFRKKINNE